LLKSAELSGAYNNKGKHHAMTNEQIIAEIIKFLVTITLIEYRRWRGKE